MNGPSERKRVSELRLDVSLLRAPRYVFVLSCLCLSIYVFKCLVYTTCLCSFCTCSCLVQFTVCTSMRSFFSFLAGRFCLKPSMLFYTKCTAPLYIEMQMLGN
jgi:hypothetical protein